MNTDEMKYKLMNLRGDLLIGKVEEKDTIAIAQSIRNGESNKVVDDFIKNTLFCNTTKLSKIACINGNMNDVLLEFSMKIDDYQNKIIEESNEILKRYADGIRILILILKLPMPYSSLLYLRYYKNMRVADIVKSMEVSRSYYYANLRQGILKLCKLYDRHYSPVTNKI